MKKFFATLSVLVLITSCKGKTEKVSAPAKFDPSLLQAASQTYCDENEVLMEDVSASTYTFQDVPNISKVFGFSTNEVDCAFEKGINEIWKDATQKTMTFVVDTKTRCVRNNSLWALRSYSKTDGLMVLVLKSLDNGSEPDIMIKSTPEIVANYAKDKVGLRLLTCKMKPSN